MNLLHFPLRLQAGRIVSLRLEQFPATQRTRSTCPAGSSDSGWRIQTEACEHSHFFPPLNAAWQRLACATHTPQTLADVQLMLHAFPASGDYTPDPLPHRWCGRDLRPWLGDPAARQQLLQLLATHRRQAQRLLPAELAQFAALVESTTATPRSQHLWLPWLRKRPLSWSPALEHATDVLNRGHEPDRESLIATLLQEGEHAWLPVLARQSPAEHLPLMRVLVETKQHLRPPPAKMQTLLMTLYHLVTPRDYTTTAKTCCMSLANGCTPQYLAHALRFHLRWKMPFQTQARPAHEPRRRQLHTLMHSRACKWLRKPSQIWPHATGLKDWSSAIERLLARPRDKVTLDTLLECLRHLGRKRGLDACKWTHWLDRWDDMLRELDATPRAKLPLATDLIEAWRINPTHSHMSRHSVGQLLRWLARAREFEKHPGDDVPVMIEAFWSHILKEDEQTLLQTPEKTWRQMQPALAGYSSRSNAITGLWQAKNLPAGALVGMLHAAPLALIRTLRRIGELASQEREDLWKVFQEHPLITCDIARTPLPHLIVLVDAIQCSHPRFPGVPDKLRSPAKLPAHVQTHYLEELTRHIHRLRLAVLDDLAEWALRRRFPALAGKHIGTHTLRVAAAAGDENRRPFRRLLRACEQQQGTREWSLAHPANQQWLRKLPRPRLELWNEGFVIEREVLNIGTVRLGPEENLQAILRMGTDFGTCLSAGSFNSFSTAANALDANKRVLYALDSEGRVWARQLLAIAESGHLVCFPVYARKSHAVMRQLFSAYDHTFAQALRLPLWLSEEQQAPVAKIVCKEWYDDGIWRP